MIELLVDVKIGPLLSLMHKVQFDKQKSVHLIWSLLINLNPTQNNFMKNGKLTDKLTVCPYLITVVSSGRPI